MQFIYVVDYSPLDADGVYSAVQVVASGNSSIADSNLNRKVWVMTNSETDSAITLANVSISKAVYGYGVSGSFIAKSTAGIGHSDVRISSENDTGDLTLTLPFDHELAQLYYLEQPSGSLYLSIYEKETDTAAPIAIWTGVIKSCEFSGLVEAQLNAEHVLKHFNKSALTATHSRACQNVLYSKGCEVKASEIEPGGYFKHREDGFITEFGDNWIKSTELANRPAGFFNGGYVVLDGVTTDSNGGFRPRATYPIPAVGSSVFSGGFRRSVVSHTVSAGVATLVFDTLLPSVLVSKVIAFRGCDKSKATCQSTFNNYKKYNGYPYIPIKNIFESGANS